MSTSKNQMRRLAGIFDVLTAMINIYCFISEVDYLIFVFQDWAVNRGIHGFGVISGFITDTPIGFLIDYFDLAVLALLAAILGFAGAIAALRGRKWGLAFLGSIATSIVPVIYIVICSETFIRRLSQVGFLLSATAIVLTVLSRKSFVKSGRKEIDRK
jgi:hypothetical protein